ncbi:unnamed protein product, partial [Cochlearia groenlandica]
MDFKFFFIFSLLLFILLQNASFGSAANPKCISTERDALLTFRQSLTDLSGRLSSWSGPDCCSWAGVDCDVRTSHVIKIDLRNPNQTVYSDEYKRSSLRGKIHPSLTRLKFLTYLDLSSNDFNGSRIPEFIGQISTLRYLNLSSSSFSGEIPQILGNLSKLESLDLYAESSSGFALSTSNLAWLSGLSSSLTYLNMGYVNLSGVGETWLQGFSILSKLKELHLDNCEIKNLPLSLPSSSNFKLLEVLDLSDNSLSSPIPDWLFGLTSLRKLFLRWGFLQGSIPSGFKSLKLLETLDLSNNLGLQGEIPSVLGDLPRLKYLDLSANELTGQIHGFLDAFSRNKGNNSMVYLDLSSNSLSGTLPESLGALRNLQIFDLSSNSFTGSLPSSIGNMASLTKLDISYNAMNGKIAESLGKLEKLVQTKLTSVRLTNNGIEDTIPDTWFSGIASQVRYLILSNNRIKGRLPQKLAFPELQNIDLSSNDFEGPFPLWSTNATELRLYHNHFSGSLPLNIDVLMPRMEKLYLFDNSFTGEIPSSLCELSGLQIISLRKNRFSGSFPKCWHRSFMLYGIDVSENSLSGEIPSSLGLSSLETLDLSRNKFSGAIPQSLASINSLKKLNLS